MPGSAGEPANRAGSSAPATPEAGRAATAAASGSATPPIAGASGSAGLSPREPADDDAGAGMPTPTPDGLVIDQTLSQLRPEILDFFWNHLDAEHFEQWSPPAHETFSWMRAPMVPGDLGAEVGASFQSTELVADTRRELTVTYVDRAVVAGQITLEYAMVADVVVDGATPVRWIVQYEPAGEDLHVVQSLALPASETPEPWREHFAGRMTNLTDFLPAWFQTQYVEGELTARGQRTITTVGEGLTAEYELVIEQPIGKLTPEMMDWWWDNIKDTARYQRWHPTAHQKFTWTTAPKNNADLAYDVGAVQQIVEVIGEPTTLNITWLEPSGAPMPLTYDHFVYGSTLLDATPFGGFLLHEYTAQPQGSGIVMKSTFRIPALAGMPFAEALAAHCVQEMQFLQYFVPGLFAAEYKP
ncbi:MAG: hypothetical protein ABW321_20335 [Polyangiales bacterium]